MKLDRVTITGADESVTPYDLCVLSDEFPFVEWGVLCSESREGREPRYPSRAWVDNLFERTNHVVRFAAHLCGRWSRDATLGPFLWAIERHDHWRRFGRIQFNGANPDVVWHRVCDYGDQFREKGFVLQLSQFDGWGGIPHGPAFLLDNSGGRGVVLAEYPNPVPGAYCGYSGGIGPETIRSVLEAVCDKPGDAPFWIDMESNVRSEVGGRSVLDLGKVRFCLEVARDYLN